MLTRGGYAVLHLGIGGMGELSQFRFFREDDLDTVVFFVEWWRKTDTWSLFACSDEKLSDFMSVFFPNSACREAYRKYVFDIDKRDVVWFKLAFE